MSLSTAKMTAQQYVQLGEDPPGVRLELVAGEIVVAPSPKFEHNHALGRLYKLLDDHLIALGQGNAILETDVKFSEYDIRRPDISVYFRDLDLKNTYPLPAPPDLCVEVLSPSSVEGDQREKMAFYAKHQVPAYWIVDPTNQHIAAYLLEGDAFKLAAEASGTDVAHLPPVEAMEIPLRTLWA